MRTLQNLKQKDSSVFDNKDIEFKDLRESTTYEYEVVGAEVGDSKQTAFYPQVKMKKWDNECNFSLRFNYPIAGSVEKLSNTIYWKSDDKKVEAVFYEIAPCRNLYYVFGGFEFEVIFNEKPISNKIEFSIQSKNFDFYKQIKLDDLMTSCADMIIDSYAVYHSSKKHNKYTTGKAFQIYRSFVYDSNERREYCDMNIEGNILTITISQDFIDNAVYPIHLDPTIGNTNIGAYRQVFYYHSAIACSSGIPIGINPQAVRISAFACWRFPNEPEWTPTSSEVFNARMAIWNKTTGKFIAQTYPDQDGRFSDQIWPYVVYDLPGWNGATGGKEDPTHSAEMGHRPNWVDGGFKDPQSWYTQQIVPNAATGAPSENTGERETSLYHQTYLVDNPVSIPSEELYIGCIFKNDGSYDYWGALAEYQDRNFVEQHIIRFDIVPAGGYGCEAADETFNPTLYVNSPTYGMFDYPYDLTRIPIGDGQWDDRNYSVYLEYTSSSSVSSSSSSSSTSSSSSSSHSFTINTMGENTSDDYNNVIEDTYLREDLDTRNYGKSALLAVNGVDIGNDKNILIKIDYTPLPVGANILLAKLYVKTGYLGQGVDNRDFINVYKMLANWNEGDEDNYPPPSDSVDPTWSHMEYSTTEWNTAGANGSGTDHVAVSAANVYIALKEVLSQEQWYSFDITSEVIEQIAGSNFGFILTGSGHGYGGDIPIVSSDGENGSRPYLYIEYN